MDSFLVIIGFVYGSYNYRERITSCLPSGTRTGTGTHLTPYQVRQYST